MAEWLIEEGIGETRAVRLEHGDIAEARLDWPGKLGLGLVAEARLVVHARGSARGTAEFADGSRAVVDRLPPGANEGSLVRVTIVRPAMAESGRHKLARARPSDAPLRPALTLAERLAAEGHKPMQVARFPDGDWSGLMAEAFAGEVAFAGGTLLFSPTPAMLLVDIDGEDDPARLALAACRPIAAALRRFDVGGAIGIDFPSLAARADRQAVDAALAVALAGWPHERTAMNGFGFVQLVARQWGPSLLHRAAFFRAAAAARLLLRRAERLEGAGVIELSGHPALAAPLLPAWLDELRRRTGRPHRWRADPALALEAPQAQLVPQ